MNNKLAVCQIIVKNILTLFLIYGTYTETGIWTALTLLLIVISFGNYEECFKQLVKHYNNHRHKGGKIEW